MSHMRPSHQQILSAISSAIDHQSLAAAVARRRIFGSDETADAVLFEKFRGELIAFTWCPTLAECMKALQVIVCFRIEWTGCLLSGSLSLEAYSLEA